MTQRLKGFVTRTDNLSSLSGIYTVLGREKQPLLRLSSDCHTQARVHVNTYIYAHTHTYVMKNNISGE